MRVADDGVVVSGAAMLGRQVLFSAEEYQRRLNLVRSRMAAAHLDSLIVAEPANICYLTGYQTFGESQQFLLVPADGGLLLVLRELESGLADLTTWSVPVLTYGDGDAPHVRLIQVLQEFGLSDVALGVEENSGRVSPLVWRLLDDALPTARLVPSDGVIETVRLIKSPLELEACRRSAWLTGIGMTAAIGAAAPGVTENHVAAAAAAAMYEAGSEWLATDPIVTSGPRSGIAHTTFARRVLEPGDSILVELGASYHRYFAPLMRTVAIGQPSPEMLSLYHVCEEALAEALAMLRPGISSGEVHAACQRVIDDAGLTNRFKKRLGYSVGIGFETWSEGHTFDLKAGDPRTIEAGMVLHLPPALRVPGVLAAGLSETVVVTSEGCEQLGSSPRHLHQA